ncbi:hypothetical protein [Variovorax paradoxus]|uniref:hypothetical protein n=1 Tax=Variovorax paradoxus TaxID=34073 RepID=UPI003D650E21
MTILQEIHVWTKDLSAWQQDAIAMLYADRMLGAVDLDDLYALAKAEAGIPDPEGRVSKKLQDAQVAPLANPARVVLLTAIGDLANVNALANGARLPIARAGVTTIYGENGVGKSGYSRVFKKASGSSRRSALTTCSKLPASNARTAGPRRCLVQSGRCGVALCHENGTRAVEVSEPVPQARLPLTLEIQFVEASLRLAGRDALHIPHLPSLVPQRAEE